MATPTILINSTGSDTAASGAGPSTALTGTAASTNAGGTVVTLDGSPDLTGVATDGSHVIWISTASGRQFAAITAKDNSAKTVTVTAAYTGSLTGQAWAIGGKRASLDNANTRKLFSADVGTGWVVDLQEAGSSYTLTSTLTITNGSFTFSSSTTNRPLITTSVNSMKLITFPGQSSNVLRHLSFSHTAGTRGFGFYASGGACSNFLVQDCVFDGFSVAIDGENAAGSFFPNIMVDSCEFKNGVGNGSTAGHAIFNTTVTTAVNSFFHDNQGVGLWTIGSGSLVRECVLARNLEGINLGSVLAVMVLDNIFHANTGSGLETSGSGVISVVENIFYGNGTGGGGGYGVKAGVANYGPNRSNAYGGNATGDRLTFAAGSGDVALSADPCVNAAGNDFTLNSAAGGGAALKGVVNNVLAPGLVGTGHGDVGPFQSQASAGSSGSPSRPIQPNTWSYFG